jgi:methyl-accepting chemotaxis protein
VVAEEVRNLATKSAEAARETSDMIQNSMDKAFLGSTIASETATSLTEIVHGISESSRLVEEIAQASDAQSIGISQINIGINQVSQVIQQNSATAEENAATAEEMSSQSAILQGLVSQYMHEHGEAEEDSAAAPARSELHDAPVWEESVPVSAGKSDKY